MRFVMLARNPGLYSHVRLCEAARARGHSIDVINTLHVHMNITSNQPVLRYNGRRLPIYDAVIPRIGASITHYGLAVLRQFEMQGVYPLERERRHRPLARQAARAADPCARGHRPAGDGVRARAPQGRGRDQGGRRRPRRHQARSRARKASASSSPRPRARPSRSSRRSARPTSTSWCRSSSARRTAPTSAPS